MIHTLGKRWLLALALLTSLAGCREPGHGDGDGGANAVDAGGTTDLDAATPGLRVATVNLRCLLEEWDARAPLLTLELAALNPDVIALQEVCREEGGADALPDLIARLEAATGEHYDVSRAETHIAWDVYHEGIALVTRHSFDQVETLDLPVGVFPRKAVVGRITHLGHPLMVAATHLSFGDQGAVRASQLGALREHMESLRSSDATLLIAGDLNEGPTGEALLAAKDAEYQDTWALLHPDDEGPTYPADDPRSRIDYLLLSPPDSPPGVSMRALQVQRFLQDSSGGRYPSDHLGVWAELGPVD